MGEKTCPYTSEIYPKPPDLLEFLRILKDFVSSIFVWDKKWVASFKCQKNSQMIYIVN